MYDDVYISKKGKGLTKTSSLVIGHIKILIDIYRPINRPGNSLQKKKKIDQAIISFPVYTINYGYTQPISWFR